MKLKNNSIIGDTFEPSKVADSLSFCPHKSLQVKGPNKHRILTIIGLKSPRLEKIWMSRRARWRGWARSLSC